jgi:hypothetical protein
MVLGCGMVVVGAGISWGVYWFSQQSGHLFFVVGIVGLAIAVGGLVFGLGGLLLLLTGGVQEAAETGSPERKDEGVKSNN